MYSCKTGNSTLPFKRPFENVSGGSGNLTRVPLLKREGLKPTTTYFYPINVDDTGSTLVLPCATPVSDFVSPTVSVSPFLTPMYFYSHP